MNAILVLAAIAGVPVLLALFMRVSAVFLFTSIAAGSLLVSYWGDDAGLALGMMMRGQNTNLIAQLILLLLPVVLSLFFLKRTMPKSKFLLHLPVQVANSLTLAVLALPLLDSNIQKELYANHYGNALRESQDVVVGVTALLIMFIMWMTYRHKEDKKHKKKRH